MSSICGYWFLNQKKDHSPIVYDMLARLNHWKADNEDTWIGQSIAFGHLMLFNTPESLTETLPFYQPSSQCCITADARIDNRSELAVKLMLDEHTAKEKADSWYILQAYQKWGEDCTRHLEGDFAFAIWDEEKQKIFCARDQIGIKPFYYYYNDGLFAFATEIKGILAIQDVDRKLNRSWIAHYIVNNKKDKKSSAFSHIFRLEAAHQISITPQNFSMKKYWELDITKKTYFPKESDYADAFLEKLDQAIQKRLRSNWAVSAELSGGLDSALIIALAKKTLDQKDKQLITVSDIMPKNASEKDPKLLDDRELVMNVIRYIGVENYHLITGEERSFIESLNRIVEIQDEPTPKMLNIFADLMYEKVEASNSRVILSGFGGNDFVSQMGDFFHEELFRSGKWRTLWREIKLRSQRLRSSPYRRLLNVIFSSCVAAYSTNYRYYKVKYINRKTYRLAKERLQRAGIKPQLLEEFDLEEKAIKATYANFKGKTMSEKSKDRLDHFSFFPDRLDYSNLSTAHNRIEYRYPLLDVPLIEFFLSIPSHEKIKNGWNRYLYRNAGTGLIPEELQWGESKASSPTPSFLWRMFRDKQLIVETLESLPKESDIHQYMDVASYMKYLKENVNKEKFNNFGGSRLYLLQHFLDRLKQ